MPKHLMLLVSLILLALVPGCELCKKKESKKPAKRPAKTKKVKMEQIKVSDLYDFDEEEITLAEAEENDFLRNEEEMPQKF